MMFSVATSGWHDNVPEFFIPLTLLACCVRQRPGNFDGATCKLLMGPCQHVTIKVSGIVNISRMAGHAAQQHAFEMS